MHDEELRAQLADWVRPVATLPVPDIDVLRRRARRRQMRRAVTAAAITVVIAAAAVGITASLPGSGPPPAVHPAAGAQGVQTWSAAPGTWIQGHWQPAGPLAAADAGPASAPYFVAVQPGSGRAVVTDAFTGQVLATVKPGISGSSFAGVAAAGDDRTFILASQDTGFVAFSELRLKADGRLSSLDVLFILPLNTVPVFAVSPDARMLGFVTGTGVEVVSLAQQLATSWTAAGGQASSLSWAGDKTLAFEWSAPSGSAPSGSAAAQPPGAGVRLLDISAAGTLQQASRLIIPYCRSSCASSPLVFGPVITPDGSKVLAGVLALGKQVTVQIEEFSARTGQPLAAVTPRIAVSSHTVVCQPLWTDSSGAQQTAYCERGGTFTGGRFQAADLHLPVSLLTMAGQLIAW